MPHTVQSKAFSQCEYLHSGEAAFCWHKRPLACPYHRAGIGLRLGTGQRIQRPDRILSLGLGRQGMEQSTGTV